jgi:hypothetical protein
MLFLLGWKTVSSPSYRLGEDVAQGSRHGDAKLTCERSLLLSAGFLQARIIQKAVKFHLDFMADFGYCLEFLSCQAVADPGFFRLKAPLLPQTLE